MLPSRTKGPVGMAKQTDIRPDVWAAMRACRLWRTASDSSIAELAAGARIVDVVQGASLAVEGQAATDFAVLVAGRVRVFYLGADGRQITFESLEPGDAIAAVAAIAGARYPAHIEASTDATIARVQPEALFQLMEREPQVARTLISDLAARVVNFTSVVQTLAMDVPARLARYIFQRALQSGQPVAGGLSVDLGMKKAELAMALGTVPETLSRAFARLKDEQVLEVHGGKVTVMDVRALASMASGYDEG